MASRFMERLDRSDMWREAIASYSNVGKPVNDTLEIMEALETAQLSCLICLESIGRKDAINSCQKCFVIIHSQCIQAWAKQKIECDEVPDCPKCRTQLNTDEIRFYKCFCLKEHNPKDDPWEIPHSCGQKCQKALTPKCGHACILACHPGSCPPCLQMMSVSCFCGSQKKQMKRCFDKDFSCEQLCGKKLSCQVHSCPSVCHPGSCDVCELKSKHSCQCGLRIELKLCSEADWRCDKVCGKLLSCGNHSCEEVCHAPGECGDCPKVGLQSCPCGSTNFELTSCLDIIPTCHSTCGKLLDCGLHTCNDKCHSGKCKSFCSEIIKNKRCVCGERTKDYSCQQSFNCETKCGKMKSCGRHPCKRKCCTSCPPCDQVCKKPLQCGKHRCDQPCHRGACYPCISMETFYCPCKQSCLTLSCARASKLKKQQNNVIRVACRKPCQRMPSCRHGDKRPSHTCHSIDSDCPPCPLVCGQVHNDCGHTCQALCHEIPRPEHIAQFEKAFEKEQRSKSRDDKSFWRDVVGEAVVKEKRDRLAKLSLQIRECPPCKTGVEVSCPGLHCRRTDTPCHESQLIAQQPCSQVCGQLLPCGRHACQKECHTVSDKMSCGTCERVCQVPRPATCQHACPKGDCHKGECPPCRRTLSRWCYCNTIQLQVFCFNLSDQSSLACGTRCARMMPCGHRCRNKCHPPLPSENTDSTCLQIDNCPSTVVVKCRCGKLSNKVPCPSGGHSLSPPLPCESSCKVVKQVDEIEDSPTISDSPRSVDNPGLMPKPRRRKRRNDDDSCDEDVGWLRKLTLFTQTFTKSPLAIFIVSIVVIFLSIGLYGYA